jgi:hypothetical protein
MLISQRRVALASRKEFDSGVNYWGEYIRDNISPTCPKFPPRWGERRLKEH